MKNQPLFSSKDNSKKKIKCGLLQFLFGASRVKRNRTMLVHNVSHKQTPVAIYDV